MALNSAADKIRCLNSAAGESEGDLVFLNEQDSANHVLPEEQQSDSTVAVKVEPLDSLCASVTPAAMKVDVEGYEVPVIRGAKNLLKSTDLNAIIIELCGIGSRYGYNEEEVISTLQDLGFSDMRYDPFQRELLSPSSDLPETSNRLFIRNKEYVQERLKSAQSWTIQGQRL